MSKSIVKKEALKFLKSNHVAAVATAHKVLPYISVVYYVADDDFNLYFLTKKDTDKFLNLSTNSNIAVAIGFGPKHVALQLRGHAEPLGGAEREALRTRLRQMIKDKKIKHWPLTTLEKFTRVSGENGAGLLYRVTPQHLTFFNLDDENYPQSLSKKIHSVLP